MSTSCFNGSQERTRFRISVSLEEAILWLVLTARDKLKEPFAQRQQRNTNPASSQRERAVKFIVDGRDTG